MRYGLALIARFGQFARPSRKVPAPDAFELRLGRLVSDHEITLPHPTPFRATA